LRLNDPHESRIDVRKAGALPGNASGSVFAEDIRGRGLTEKKQLFQASLPTLKQDLTKVDSKAAENAALAFLHRQVWSGRRALPLPQLGFPLPLQHLQYEMGREGFLLGKKEFHLGQTGFSLENAYLDLLNKGPHFQVWGDPRSGKTTVLSVCLEGLQARYKSTQVKIAIIESGQAGQTPLFARVKSSYLLTQAWLKKPESLKQCMSLLKEQLQPRLQMAPEQALQEAIKTHYVLLVDNYDTNLMKDIISDLSTLVTQGTDIGFHLILSGPYNIAASSVDTLIKVLKNTMSPGLLLHSGVSQSRILYDQAPAPQTSPGRGFLVSQTQKRLTIQVALPAGPVELEDTLIGTHS
jgi:hypothetical protein